MKKYLIGAVALLALAACGESKTEVTGETREPVVENTVNETTPAEEVVPAEEAVPEAIETEVTTEAPPAVEITVEELKASGTFLMSCKDESITDGVLTASCRKLNGNMETSSVSLAACTNGISNIDGVLKCTE